MGNLGRTPIYLPPLSVTTRCEVCTGPRLPTGTRSFYEYIKAGSPQSLRGDEKITSIANKALLLNINCGDEFTLEQDHWNLRPSAPGFGVILLLPVWASRGSWIWKQIKSRYYNLLPSKFRWKTGASSCETHLGVGTRLCAKTRHGPPPTEPRSRQRCCTVLLVGIERFCFRS